MREVKCVSIWWDTFEYERSVQACCSSHMAPRVGVSMSS